MNYKTIMFAIAILIAVLLYSYFQFSSKYVDVRLLIDETDPYIARPDAEQLLSLFQFNDHPWNGGSFHARSITDMDYNKRYKASVPPMDFFQRQLANDIARKSAITKFTENTTMILDSLFTDSVGRAHSSVYRVIARELNELSSETGPKRKVLLVYGDLRENSFLNLYDPKLCALLRTNPDSIATIFTREVPLYDLTGVEVYLIYEPSKYKDNEPYLLISHLYQKMLEGKGAKVKISANLTV